jgi:predicted deacetylase
MVFKGFAITKEVVIISHIKYHGLDRIEYDNEPAQLWVEVHDISPGYGVEKLTEITDILERHKNASDRIVLFIIPNHGGSAPISSYPEFTAELGNLSNRGFILGIHGFTHQGGLLSSEFKTNLSNGIRLIQLSQNEFSRSELGRPKSFAPPEWRASHGVSKYLRKEFDYSYYAFFIDTPSGTLPYSTYEYTWYDLSFGGLDAAKKDYVRSKGIFRLTIHINAVNSPENLDFLEQFLIWVEGYKNL